MRGGRAKFTTTLGIRLRKKQIKGKRKSNKRKLKAGLMNRSNNTRRRNIMAKTL